jgi:hypothetical protein
MASLALSACSTTTTTPKKGVPGVVFTYPIDQQVDVPLGTNLVVTFSDPVTASAVTCPTFCVMGPDGAANITPQISSDGRRVTIASPGWDPAAQYQLIVGQAVMPEAENLPSSGALVSFTTRGDRPRAAAPTLVAVNGGSPTMPESFRPMLETSTIRLVFSEPLDPRTTRLAPGSIELLDASGTEVPATVIAQGIHAAIDPVDDLTPGMQYTLRLGSSIQDLGGQAFAQTDVMLTPANSKGNTMISQVLRSRQPGDPGTKSPRTADQTNTIIVDKPLIGKHTCTLNPGNMAAELGDPQALGGPIAVTIRKGQRLSATGLDVKLGGVIPSGLSTGDLWIELLTDAGGRMYRNPHQNISQAPDNDNAPLYADLSMDVGLFATDAAGNAVLTQTVLGVQATGIATATDGVLDMEAATSMDLGLLGVATAPSNMSLELITDSSASATPNTAAPDTTPPTLTATFPGTATSELPVDSGIELIFSEPVDLVKLNAGGLALTDAAGNPVDAVIESHGAAVVVRPTANLAYSATYTLNMSNVTDVAGNPLPSTGALTFSTPTMATTAVPLMLVSSHPGVPCSLTNGHCTGGLASDDTYHPFTLAANDTVRLAFSQPLNPGSVALGTTCSDGDVRIEQFDSTGACAAVPGTMILHDRGIEFIPDVPWTSGASYRLTLVSGGNTSCGAGVVCGLQSAASFDPLMGTTPANAGGPDFVIDFTATDATTDTPLFAAAGPFTDINGSGTVDGAEVPHSENQAAMRIDAVHGLVSAAHFNGPDCVPSTPAIENCQYVQGAMTAIMQDAQTNCTLPDGSTAASCIPVIMTPQAMFGTSVSMSATAVIITIPSNTGTSVMRMREPADGPITAYIVDAGDGTAKLVAQLGLYMDAPDMVVPLGGTTNVHSKPLTVSLSGPVRFLADGRIALALSNDADVPVSITISTALGSGSVDVTVPMNEMNLQLVSPAVRGAMP